MYCFEYDAIRTRQTPDSEWLITLSAPARDIDTWAGIPQKQRPGGQETLGFQRDENASRIAAIKKFYGDSHNIIQNPLLCAVRQNVSGKVTFEKTADGIDTSTEIGKVKIEVDDLESLALKDLLARVKQTLEARIPGLKRESVDPDLIVELKQKANLVEESTLGEEAATSEEDDESQADEGEDEPAESTLFTEESHVYDFWQQLSARIAILEEGSRELNGASEFQGFSREAMAAFLKPVVLVDGQHRLRGAVEDARQRVGVDPAVRTQIETQILNEADPDQVQREAERSVSRRLPISLLMTKDPAEHVFQFVVVNQKATPIGRALLGTIISTTLSNDELSRVSDRLEGAGIPLLESRAVAYLARNPSSPFCNLVEQGLPNEDGDRLPWSVMRSLVQIFQHLKGGKPFHRRTDYADLWRRKFLSKSGLVQGAANNEDDDAFKFWSRPDGPWRNVFIDFWACIRDCFGETGDKQAKNYWGTPRNSQLFNKISLTVLSADFFNFLCQKELALDSVSEVPAIIDRWLQGVSQNYFNRAWKIAGIKKDHPGIRKRWAKLWEEYRDDPKSLPDLNEYGKILVE